jgi:hypothetical protein
MTPKREIDSRAKSEAGRHCKVVSKLGSRSYLHIEREENLAVEKFIAQVTAEGLDIAVAGYSVSNSFNHLI